MALYSEVFLKGTVVGIDLEKRDITLQVGTDRVICHLWTTRSDTHGAWRSPIEWREMVYSGCYVDVQGYLGNYGRVVVAPGNLTVLPELQDEQNAIRGVGKKISDTEIEFATPYRGKQVIVHVDCPDFSGYQDGEDIAFLGLKTQDSIKLTNHQKVLYAEDLFDVEEYDD